MSCRVLGLGVVQAMLAEAMARMSAAGAETVFAAMVHTERNQPCRDWYAYCGFEPVEGGWRRAVAPRLECPAHVALTDANVDAPPGRAVFQQSG